MTLRRAGMLVSGCVRCSSRSPSPRAAAAAPAGRFLRQHAARVHLAEFGVRAGRHHGRVLQRDGHRHRRRNRSASRSTAAKMRMRSASRRPVRCRSPSPPDFEAPTDVGGDNLYRVTLRASDGMLSSAMALSVTVTDRSSIAFRVRRVASGIASPVFVAAVPDGTGRVYVGELAGRIDILSPGTGTIAPMPLLDLRGQLSTNGERGLLGFATSPDFTSSGQFYVFVTDPVGTIEVRRYTREREQPRCRRPSTMRVILRQPHPRTNHNGGWIGFDRTGLSVHRDRRWRRLRRSGQQRAEPRYLARQDPAHRHHARRFPGRHHAQLRDPGRQPVPHRRRCAGSVGAGPAQSVPRELRLRAVRHGRRRTDHRRRRRRHGRGNRRDARPGRQPGRELRLVGARGIAAVQGPRRSGLPLAGGRIPARHRAARGQHRDRRRGVSRAGGIACAGNTCSRISSKATCGRCRSTISTGPRR